MVSNYNLRTETVETEGSVELSGLLVLLNCQALNSGRDSVSKTKVENDGEMFVFSSLHIHTHLHTEIHTTLTDYLGITYLKLSMNVVCFK